MPAASPARRQQLRRYLMCRPTYFDVRYSINPWMNPDRPTSARRAMRQWQQLHDVLVDLGHHVDVIEPVRGLPDMVFAANAGIALGRSVLVARFRYPQRQAEAGAYLDWFRHCGYPEACQAEAVNEGEGDYLVAGSRILAGSGFRTAAQAHQEVEDRFGLPVTPLTLVDERYYHLDTALTVLDDHEIAYYPPAFCPASRAVLRELFPGALVADDDEAAVLGLNAVSDGLNVVLPTAAPRLAAALKDRGYQPAGVDLSELLKSGGGAKCCTLELHPAPAAAGSSRARGAAA